MLDEYPYLLEHTPELDSIIQRAFGPRNRLRTSSRSRLVLCGSAMTVMRRILSGSAPLHGRAGLDLRISPFDFRVARELHGIDDLRTALRTFAVIGGVAAYAREMVGGDLPTRLADFDRWVCRRVLSPAAPLFNEVGLLLSENPSTAKARKINLYHAALAGAASGHHTHGTIIAIGEAKAGERISERHLRRLEAARSALGRRAKDAKLLFFGAAFAPKLLSVSAQRADVELIDLERMYTGD